MSDTVGHPRAGATLGRGDEEHYQWTMLSGGDQRKEVREERSPFGVRAVDLGRCITLQVVLCLPYNVIKNYLSRDRYYKLTITAVVTLKHLQ